MADVDVAAAVFQAQGHSSHSETPPILWALFKQPECKSGQPDAVLPAYEARRIAYLVPTLFRNIRNICAFILSTSGTYIQVQSGIRQGGEGGPRVLDPAAAPVGFLSIPGATLAGDVNPLGGQTLFLYSYVL